MSAQQSPQSPLSSLVGAVVAGASWVSVLALWASAASVYVNPNDARIAAVLGLAFPLALAGTLFMLAVSLLFAFRKSWIPLFGLACCFGAIMSYCPFHPFRAAHLPSNEALRVMNYNVQSFHEAPDDSLKAEMLQYILDQAADVVVMQEGTPLFRKWSTLAPTFDERYPYVELFEPENDELTHPICCSRYPIIRQELITQSGGNCAVACWIAVPRPGAATDTLIVVNTHLKSNQLSPDDRLHYRALVKPDEQGEGAAAPIIDRDSTYRTTRHLAAKIAEGAQHRAAMADTIAAYVRAYAQHPVIVAGDFNDTPISYACSRMRRTALTDAFRTAGTGMGRSFNQDAIAVRIDHQFASAHLKPVDARIDKTFVWSDHYPLVVTYEWVKPE